jgi:hypothetical protein
MNFFSGDLFRAAPYILLLALNKNALFHHPALSNKDLSEVLLTLLMYTLSKTLNNQCNSFFKISFLISFFLVALYQSL